MSAESRTPKAPKTITLKVCPVCGRHDRYTPFTGKSHFSPAGRCPGQPVDVTYRVAK